MDFLQVGALKNLVGYSALIRWQLLYSSTAAYSDMCVSEAFVLLLRQGCLFYCILIALRSLHCPLSLTDRSQRLCQGWWSPEPSNHHTTNDMTKSEIFSLLLAQLGSIFSFFSISDFVQKVVSSLIYSKYLLTKDDFHINHVCLFVCFFTKIYMLFKAKL